MPRSQTVPSLSSDPKPSAKPLPVSLKIDTSKDEEDPTPEEICLSPSWSDHGEKKRKKEKKRIEKEQKEAERKSRQDEERQRLADIKAGKRLSKKPPPVAMETQKMPQALRRNSWVSVMSSRTSSGENTRRSSREERRLSGVSIGSTDSHSRSRSTPATSTEEAHDPARTSGQWHSVVSSAAPKIPNFGWSSRRTSSGTNKSLSWGSDDGYTREIISFAYRLDGSPTNSEHKRTNETQGQQGPTTPTRQEAIPPFSRSVTEPNLASFTQQSMSRSPQRSPVKGDKTSEPTSQHGPKGTRPEQRNSAQSLKAGPNFRNELAGEIDAIIASHQQKPGQTPPSPRNSQTRSSYDGSSYVHKQRMYQQQRSIAGFEDEQAVKDANEMAAESETSVLEDGQQTGSRQAAHDSHQQYSNTVSVIPSTADDRVPVSAKSKTSVTQPDVKPSTMKQPSLVKQPVEAASSSPFKPANTKGTAKGQDSTPGRTSSQSVRDSVSLNKSQTASGSKTDKVLSFRRRPKMAPSKISVPDNVQNNTVALRSIPPAVIVIEEAPEKPPKVQRISQEVKSTHIHASGRKASESSARSQPEKSLPEPNRIPSHARNRTSSSTALSDNLPSPLSPKSVAEPHSTSNNKGSRQAGAGGDGKEPRIEAEPRSPKSPRSPKRRQTSLAITDKALPETPAAVNEAPAPDASESKETPDVKPLPEVVVESTTEEGLVRKTSIKRPRSNPQLQTQTTVTNPLPSLDFLPQLKHQPLVKREPHFLPLAKDRFPPVPTNYATIKIMANKSAASSNAPDLKLIPRSPLRTPSQFPVPGRTFNRSSTEVGTVSSVKGPVAEGMEAKPMAKLFVICCKCKFWHDLPSKLYEAMALPKELHKDDDVAAGKGKGQVTGARLETAVKCPWCEHAMTTWCCQGWTTVVYLHERHH